MPGITTGPVFSFPLISIVALSFYLSLWEEIHLTLPHRATSTKTGRLLNRSRQTEAGPKVQISLDRSAGRFPGIACRIRSIRGYPAADDLCHGVTFRVVEGEPRPQSLEVKD